MRPAPRPVAIEAREVGLAEPVDPALAHLLRAERDEQQAHALDRPLPHALGERDQRRDGCEVVVGAGHHGPRTDVGERGERLDESVPGSGLGLAIVADVAKLYGGGLALAKSDLGGLEAKLTLPAIG